MATSQTLALKQKVAQAALEHIPKGCILGVGSGSTITEFIHLLPNIQSHIEACVASSVETERLLKQAGFLVYDLNAVDAVHLYIDSADACNSHKQLIKGKGGAMTREKILAASAEKFLCLLDEDKWGDRFLNTPIPVEVIPMARGLVARTLVGLGGKPSYRQGFVTDNGNIILDVTNLKPLKPLELEAKLKSLTGVLDSGLFAQHAATQILVAYRDNRITMS